MSVILFSCKGRCDKIGTTFSSYEQAIKQVKQSSFTYTDDISASGSSWITGAAYYSCDGKVGFLLLNTSDREYIHKSIPASLWTEFKNAPSFGKFYNSQIKGRYQMDIHASN